MSVAFKWKQENFQKLIDDCPDEPVTPYIFKYFPNPDEEKLLEAGCGSGRYVYYLNELGYDITGLELEQETVDTLNDVYPNLDIIQGDVTKLPFDDDSFTGILSLGVIEHVIEGMDDPIKEMYRVLQKGGYALVIVPSFNYIRRIKYALGYYHLMGLIKYSNFIRKCFNKSPIKYDKNEKIYTSQSRFKHWDVFGRFIEYRLTKQQFEEELSKAGFLIIESVPVSLIDGIYHEFGRMFVKYQNLTFYPNQAGRWLNNTLSKIPFCHNHMHLCVVRK